MSSQMQFPTPQFLAEHHQFVRRLALSLAHDEASAEDLVQETWLAALRSGTRSIAHPRAWLATTLRRRALNVVRSEDVRAGHERRAARSEAVEDERLRERVGFQQNVVAEVLALEEPYRTVVLWRYFHGWSPAMIARKRGIPAVTVRSQLARAQQQLRRRLEERQGGREVWSFALVGFLEHSKPALFSTPALTAIAAVCVVAAGIGTARLIVRPLPSEAREFALVGPATTPDQSLAGPSDESARIEAARAEREIQKSTRVDELAGKSLDELKAMLIRVEDELRPRLLTPPADVVATWHADHPEAEMEFARILDRSVFESAGFDSGAVGVRGGGAYYSFVTRSHSYDDEPTIELQGGSVRTNVAGYRDGIVLDLGEAGPSGMPVDLDPKDREIVAILSRGPALSKTAPDPELKALLAGDWRRPGCPVSLQHAYLVRQVTPKAQDVLAVFVPLQQDQFGITIAWKLLQTWPVPNRYAGPKSTAPRESLDPEAWTSALSTQGLLQLLGHIRALTTERLMAIPDSLRDSWPGRPLARVLRDPFGTRFVNIDGGGRSFSFVTESNTQVGPDIELNGQALNSGVTGLIVDLGVTPVQAVDRSLTPPSDEHARSGWEMAWTFERKPATSSGSGRAIDTKEASKRFYDYRIGKIVNAVVGHTYLVRSIAGDRDHLVAFEIVSEDEHGIFLTWKILKTWAP